ncbi:ABC transporter ATP-binding protein [Dethiobacter alkaliphilus]|uniref:ABC transporter related protein n=1 Tax=Dethiobacter alkaliphilus AHT 1 TaxID=555088 RepID=C0GG66_DETAL|nr:ABC transporter ATP-binding protein [Dethiobacter alkaliphilus]EEG77755.1 ABC transporter related protein [Dethiobacter alkaliphilus AHT 1]
MVVNSANNHKNGGDGLQTRVEIKNLSKAYHIRKLFTDVTVTIPDRSVFVVLGHNGAGKTTFLRIMCGLIPATSGQVDYIIDGQVLTPAEKRAQLGLVSPDLQLYDDLTAVENLEFFSEVRGLPFTIDRAREMMEFVGLKGRGHDFVGTYSSGMKQRMKYAYALLHEPHILVLDEPTSNLDEVGVALVDRIIKRQKEKGIVIMATNEPEEVSYGDQTLSLA